MNLYLAMGQQGEYDDWGCWAVGVFSSRDNAKKACQKLVDEDKYDNTGTLEWAYNPHNRESTAMTKGRYSYDRTTYTIRLIELDKVIV